MRKSFNRRETRLLPIILILSLMLVLGLTQVLAASEQNQGPTTGPDTSATQSEYSGVLSTTAEAMQMADPFDRYLAGQVIPNSVLTPANLGNSTKTASPAMVMANGTARFTITVVNSGDQDVVVTMTDDLPNGLSYVSHICTALLTDECGYSGGVVTWRGTAIKGQPAVITVDVRVADDLEAGEVIENTAVIRGNGQTVRVTAAVTVSDIMSSPIQYIPYTIYGLRPEPAAVVLSAGSVNAANEWTMSWTAGIGSTSYELEESISPVFEGGFIYAMGPQTSYKIVQQPSFDNVFYYRVRSVIGEARGPWSNTVQVVGAYFDDFNNDRSGWSMRRTTFKDEVRSYYETGGGKSRYIMYVDAGYAWGIASPGRPAPRVPYVIEYESKLVDSRTPNVSSGFAFAGDWPGTGGCPSNPNSLDSVYRHTDCFNHFYNTNGIFYGKIGGNAIKLLFERVDRLDWCRDDNPPCWGSPMKRLGDILSNQAYDYNGVDPTGWNKYRIEVRQGEIRVLAGKQGGSLNLQKVYKDTRWIGDPYFGIFGSTGEWSDSIWQFEYVKVMPLDS